MIGRVGKPVALLAVLFTAGAWAVPPPADAFNVAKPICTLAGLVSGVAGKVCSAASHAGSVLKAGKKLLGGHVGGALKALTGAGTAAKTLTATAALASLVVWVVGGAKLMLHLTAKVISTTTRPQLQSTWFSSTYWRMAAISALLTLPFLFAAAIQAVLRSDLALLARSTLGYLPLAMLAISIAAPVTTLLLAGSDELSAIVSQAAGGAGGAFLTRVGRLSVGLGALSGSTFVVLFVAVLTVGATITLWIELLIRAAAVYVVVLMLPLFFAALVWPARRVWAVRAVELLVALILSKFAIVAVLSLGGAALGHTTVPSPAQMLEGATLVLLAAFSPWALLRLLPVHELTTGLDGLRSRPQSLASTEARAEQATEIAEALIRQLPAGAPDARTPAEDAGPADAVTRSLDDNAAPDPHGSATNGAGTTQGDDGAGRSSDPSGSAGASPETSGSAGAARSPIPARAAANGAGFLRSGEPAPAPDVPRAPDEPPRADPPATPGEPSTPNEPPAAPEAKPRLPGMHPFYQQDNDSRGVIDLVKPGIPHDREGTPPTGADEQEPKPAIDDDHDPRPPTQEPPKGRL
jgi:hypothetical protein